MSGGRAFKSTDRGDTWAELHFGFSGLGGCGLAVNPADSSVLWATSTAGLLKSSDGGRSWQKDTSGSRAFSKLWLDSTGSLYAGSVAGVFKSLDRGETWTTVSTTSPSEGLRNFLFDPVDSNIVYAQTELRGVFKSTNGGQSWKPINSGLPDLRVRGLVVDPIDSRTLYVGTFKRGVFKTTNGGESWKPTGSKSR
jgi:photosystem II stability/assembly factor-like uncharacterized protein